jgi:hypothetical protein
MKIAIIGSRTFSDYDFLCLLMKTINIDIDEIVSGGASGVDSLAEHYANENNIPIKIFKAEWNKYGKAAGFIRNKLIIEYADKVIAIWDGKSKGTKNSIDLATKQNKLWILKNF